VKHLSMPLYELKPFYDVVIVGSGYGGAIAASRLARARGPAGKPSVCLLERGREILDDQFPDTSKSGRAQIRFEHNGKTHGPADGLYRFYHGEEVTVLQGCGLGGTSLINANVSIRPDDRVFLDPRWPREIRDDHGTDSALDRGFARAKEMLRPSAYPDNADHAPRAKYRALVDAAAAIGASNKVMHPELNINWVPGRNHVGLYQGRCTSCGDCVGGCNVGAKNTLMTNYLPDAREHGAEIYCGVSVSRIARRGDRWCVYYQPVGFQRDKFDQGTHELFVTAGVVILAAGTLGSTEIMLRSKAAGLPCSAKVGAGFSGNGDVLGFSYNTDRPVHSIGRGHGARPSNAPGPTITGAIDLRDGPLEDGMIIEEGALPSSMHKLLGAAFAAAAKLTGTDTDQGAWDKITETLRTWASVFSAYLGATRNTGVYLVMAHEEDAGTFTLDPEGGIRLRWPGLAGQDVFQRISDKLRALTTELGGTYVPSPLFTKHFGYDMITVHPLGGCVMAPDASTGVVDHTGNVYAGATGSACHDGLYIEDGSIVPRPLGANPLLTISALAERGVALLAAARGWTIDYTLGTAVSPFDGKPAPGTNRLRFTERLSGHCSRNELGEFAAAEAAGKREGGECAGVFTIISPDLDVMIRDPDQAARLAGTVWIPSLSAESMTIFDGIFNLLVTDPANPRIKRMRYRCRLASVEGPTYYFEGTKFVEDDRGFDVLADTTTLHIVVHEGADATAPLLAKGIIRISPSDLARQLETLDARDPEGASSLRNKKRFGKLFARGLWEVYAR
jgi:cholesterol oxidase